MFKKSQIVVLETQNKVSTTVRTKYCQKSIFFLLSTLSPTMINETCFFWNNCFFFKTSPRIWKTLPWRTCRNFSPKVRQIFVKVRILLETVTLSSRNPIFHQIFVCTRKMHFWRLCRNFWAKYGRSSYWNPKIHEKIRNCWKKLSKWSSRIRKRSLFNSEQTRLRLISIFSPLSPKTKGKAKFFREVVFLGNDLPYG